MKLGEIYELMVNKGMEADPRGKEAVQKDLARLKKSFASLKEKEKQEFDKERLTNPYSDSRILYGDKDTEIRTIMVGIDIEVGEILLADRLRQNGKKIDLVAAHHPKGMALAGFYEVMHMQADILNRMGVPINVAEGLLVERIKEVERKVMPVNYARAVDAARLLNIPFICIHTPADNFVAKYLQNRMEERKPETVEEILEVLNDIPEYAHSAVNKSGPKIVVGEGKNRAGKVFVEMTGGTEGSKDIFEKLGQAGVGTLVSMHLSEEHFKKVQKEHINVIVAGHISSDTLGLNLILDELEKKGQFQFIACSGFKRFKR